MTRIKKEKGLRWHVWNCGQPTIEGAKFCASCGSPLIQTTAAAPQAPAAAESDDGTMLSSAPHMAPAPQMPTAAVHCPIAPHRQLRKPPSRSPPHRNRRRKRSADRSGAATQTVAPQAAPTQQFQYAPSPAPQPAAAPQPSQPTQQIARPAADPTITLTTPQSMKTMGASLSLGASVVRAARIDLHGQCRGQQRACRHSGLFRHRLLPGQQRCVRLRPEFLPDSLSP